MNAALRLVIALVICGIAGAAFAAETLSSARQREILRDALHAYDQAVAVARDNPANALQLYHQAAIGFQGLVDAGVQNAALEYDLGNVHFRLGDVGRAILHYRRAAALDPTDPRLNANLRYARNRVEPAIERGGRGQLLRQVLFWHYDTPLARRFAGLLALGGLGWALLFVWLRWRRRGILVSGLVCVALGLAAGASVRWQLVDNQQHPPAVVVESQPLRLGRGVGSDLALKQPLGPGVEVRILQQRDEWVEVRLANDQTGWMLASALERV